ncbi:putative glucan endo-1,3-beta-D-glucosidase NDAI_0D03700 [Naumovozyma dairenensis CBS 421]|uniref:Glycoside hydrolase family 17 protein n=1 Tax=Naumovozyma dairenensis (strain ATCC 10597 / BCRC 20456 / CBS 421 / NBRC 0211 / NRRL Y-12639) TaxID=1071378 RepID=G0WA73_NAUDC|nr:hypothetical protein NDAI_0D03700 [Naumovozyma dairenensis CBS 421]CCD24684.1 hypothetical protein NDAI_0D03700 [Naumovozyma dairenensis CBS 421]
MFSQIYLSTAFLLLLSFTNALPIFHRKQIVTRIHTASTTNTVTDVYSTTTELIIAPMVEFIISGDVTLTTTLIPEGANPTAEPTTTITKILKKYITLASQTNTLPTMTTTPLKAAATPSASSNHQHNSNNAQVSAQVTISNVNEVTTADVQSTEIKNQITITSQLENNQQNNLQPTSTTQSQQPQTTTTQQTTSTTSTNAEEQVQQPTTTTSTTQENQQPVTTTTTQGDIQTTANSASNGNSGSALTSVPRALAYSPYNADGTCKSGDAVYSDLQAMKEKGVSKIRVYGTDCNSFETIQPACNQLGIKINQGLWISSEGVDSIDSAVQMLITYGQTNGWDVFDFITVGNEAIISGYCSVSELIAKISSVKVQLMAAGYTGQITTSEPPVTFENNPELCTTSEIDFVGINPHSYFDVNSNAESAGSFVKGQLELIQTTCGTSNVVITETGYPSQGIQNGGNIPSVENQIIAVQKILDEMNQDVTILTYINDYWKAAGPYGIEQSFGISDILP